LESCLVLGTGELLGDELPVDDAPNLLHVGGATVLEVNVVGMLPDVHSEDGSLAIHNGAASVTSVLNGELSGLGVGDEPSPAAAEVSDGLSLKILLEVLDSAESGSDDLLKGLWHGLTVVSEAVPVEAVVEVLGSLVEQDGLLGLACGLLDDLLDGEAVVLVLGEVVKLVDVGPVVLVVVKVELLAGDNRLEALLDGGSEGGEGSETTLGLHEVGKGDEGHGLSSSHEGGRSKDTAHCEGSYCCICVSFEM
jgi:hypothetical protein